MAEPFGDIGNVAASPGGASSQVLGGPPPSLWSKAGDWFADANNQKMLAGLGGALATPYARRNPGLLAASNLATNAIESKAAQTAAGKLADRNAQQNMDVLKALGGLTHPTLPGPTAAKIMPNGRMSIDYTPPGNGNPQQNPGAEPPEGGGWEAKPEGGFPSATGTNPAFPVGQTTPTASTAQPTPSGGTVSKLSSLIPFYSALKV